MGHRQRGSVTLEFIGFLPFLLLTALVIWQFALAAYTLVVAEAVARDAARAATGEPWSRVWDRASAVVRAESPARLSCRVSGMEPDPRSRSRPPARQEPLAMSLTCRVPSVVRLGGQEVAMPAIIRTVQVPWEGY